MALTPIPPYIPPYVPIPTVQPFTYRDGVTYWEKLNGIIRYVNLVIIPYVNQNINDLSDEFIAEINTLITQVNTAITDNQTAVDTKITDLETYVNTTVNQIINSSVEVQDPVVSGIFNNSASQTRVVTDALYGTKNDVASLNDLVSTGRLSDINLTAEFASKSTQTTIETGYLSDTSLKSAFEKKSRNDIRDFGALANPGFDNSAFIQVAINDSIANKIPLYVPFGVFEAVGLTVVNADGFILEMDGVLKRPDNSAAVSILTFTNCTNTKFNNIRTDGNIANNFNLGVPVNEAKHDIRIENCKGFNGSIVDSKNPSGDSVYIAGGPANASSQINIDTIISVSDNETGRNALSIIKGDDMTFGKITSINTGYPGSVSPAQIGMPGGVDIEPNMVSDTVNNISFGEIFVKTSGTNSVSFVSAYGQIITNVTVGNVTSIKGLATLSATNALIIRGCNQVKIAAFSHNGNGKSNGASINDSSNIDVNADFVNIAGIGMVIGASAVVNNLRYRGSINNCGSNGITVYALANSVLDVDIHSIGSTAYAIGSVSTATMTNVKIRGSIAKINTGAQAINVSGTLTNVVLLGVDFTGWGVDTRLKGASAINVLTVDCIALNWLTATPNFDGWMIGTKIWNSAPVPGGVPGWIATASGVGGSANWKALPVLAA